MQSTKARRLICETHINAWARTTIVGDHDDDSPTPSTDSLAHPFGHTHTSKPHTHLPHHSYHHRKDAGCRGGHPAAWHRVAARVSRSIGRSKGVTAGVLQIRLPGLDMTPERFGHLRVTTYPRFGIDLFYEYTHRCMYIFMIIETINFFASAIVIVRIYRKRRGQHGGGRGGDGAPRIDPGMARFLDDLVWARKRRC